MSKKNDKKGKKQPGRETRDAYRVKQENSSSGSCEGIFKQDKLLTAGEVGPVLGVKPATISNWVYEKKIPYVKFGPGKKSIVMFNPKRLNQWIMENSHEPVTTAAPLPKNKKSNRCHKDAVERFNRFVSEL